MCSLFIRECVLYIRECVLVIRECALQRMCSLLFIMIATMTRSAGWPAVLVLLENMFSVIENVFSKLENVFSVFENVFSVLENVFPILENVFSLLENVFPCRWPAVSGAWATNKGECVLLCVPLYRRMCSLMRSLIQENVFSYIGECALLCVS